MEKTIYDKEVIRILREYIKDENFQIIESDIYFDRINAQLPFIGSRINFGLLSESKEMSFSEKEEVVTFINDIATQIGIVLDETIVYLGDSLTNLTYSFPFKYLGKIIVDILDNIPQHHYFLSQSMKWIMYISFDNCVEFGLIEMMR